MYIFLSIAPKFEEETLLPFIIVLSLFIVDGWITINATTVKEVVCLCQPHHCTDVETEPRGFKGLHTNHTKSLSELELKLDS